MQLTKQYIFAAAARGVLGNVPVEELYDLVDILWHLVEVRNTIEQKDRLEVILTIARLYKLDVEAVKLEVEAIMNSGDHDNGN